MNPKDAWISTFTGRRFYPFNPQPEMFSIEDIAHSLSMQCRFNGHIHQFYSVASHSISVSRMVPSDLALAGLMHDCAETYLGDMPKPVKDFMPQFKEAEDMIMATAAQVFGFQWPLPIEIKQADLLALQEEASSFLLKTSDRDLNEGFGIPRSFSRNSFWHPATHTHKDAYDFIARYEELRHGKTSNCGPTRRELLSPLA